MSYECSLFNCHKPVDTPYMFCRVECFEISNQILVSTVISKKPKLERCRKCKQEKHLIWIPPNFFCPKHDPFLWNLNRSKLKQTKLKLLIMDE